MGVAGSTENGHTTFYINTTITLATTNARYHNECQPPHLVDDRLHVRLVLVVSIEQRGPLLWADPQTSVHRHLDDLTVVLTAQGLVRTKL